jgi:hypothetical protein
MTHYVFIMYALYMGTMGYACIMSHTRIFLACLIGVEQLAVSWPGTFIMYIL